ncbi:MAG: DUF2735 domain-containing protein [Pseudomonadota bacterium]
MTANSGGEGAKIYEFPKGGRAGLRVAVRGDKPQAPVAAPVVWDAWYHEAAMRDETPRKQ